MRIRSSGMVLIVLVAMILLIGGHATARAEAPASGDSAATTQTTPAMEEKQDRLYPLSAERKQQLSAYAHRMRDLARRWTRRPFLALWLYLALFLALDYLLNLPFSIYRGYLVESDFGFVNQGFTEWLGENLLSQLITMAIAIIPVSFLYWLIRRSRAWWAWFSLGAIPFLVFLMVISPLVIAPLFNDFEPVDNPDIRHRVLALADKAGIEGADLFQVNASKQTSKVNAYVTGLLDSQRIVLYDNLIRNFEPGEVEFVMGHEIGHYVMHHVWYSLLIIAAFLAVSLWLMNRWIHPVIARFHDRFGFDRLDDMASLPLILIFLSLIGFILNPVTNGASRYFEHQADIYGMEISGVPGETAATAFNKLSAYNLSDPDPNPLVEFWFYNHPSLASRMAFVRNYRREESPAQQGDGSG